MWYLYLLQSDVDQYYVGITKDIDRRVSQHKTGIGAQYTAREKNNWMLVYSEKFTNRPEVEAREIQIKGWSRAKKRALIDQDFLKLQALAKNSTLNKDCHESKNGEPAEP
jgi:putative endonuclease